MRGGVSSYDVAFFINTLSNFASGLEAGFGEDPETLCCRYGPYIAVNHFIEFSTVRNLSCCVTILESDIVIRSAQHVA